MQLKTVGGEDVSKYQYIILIEQIVFPMDIDTNRRLLFEKDEAFICHIYIKAQWYL